MKLWKSLLPTAVALLVSNAICCFTAQASAPAPSLKPRGAPPATPILVHSERLVAITQDQLAAQLSPYGIKPRNGVVIYRVSYQTQSLDHSSVQASGIVIVPDNKAAVYPWISLQHGTITASSQAPSASPAEGVAEASQGFVTTVADYLGYGDAKGLVHPYIIAEGYQTSLVDMLRATREFAANEKIDLGPFFLKGYSEGGYATLALQKELETRYADEFPITASAPSAGPYVPELVGDILVAEPIVNPVNIPFVVVSYKHWLAHDQLALDQIFQTSPDTLEAAFSGTYTSSQVSQLIPAASSQLFQPDFLADFLADKPQLPLANKLHDLLRSQSLLEGWVPQTPTHFYHCKDDEQIPSEVSHVASRYFESMGGKDIDAILIPSPDPSRPYTHGTCPAIFSPLQWFAQILSARSHR